MTTGAFTYIQECSVTAVLLGVAILMLLASPAFAQMSPEKNPERNAYFGESHVHTSWSLDAFSIGNTITNPGDAYKYFKGEPIKHPLGYEVKIDTPLDGDRRHLFAEEHQVIDQPSKGTEGDTFALGFTHESLRKN